MEIFSPRSLKFLGGLYGFEMGSGVGRRVLGFDEWVGGLSVGVLRGCS